MSEGSEILSSAGDDDEVEECGNSTGEDVENSSTKIHIAFWIIGLCNNFAYVVMLSAAEDLLTTQNVRNETSETCLENVDHLKCSPISTGAVLLADIIPSLIIKLMAPFVFQSISYSIRHYIVVIFQLISFLIIAFSGSVPLSILGIIFASMGAGLGEVTYLSLSSYFHSEVVSFWSSGTGGAGILGSISFAALTDKRLFAMNPKSAILMMLIIPLTQSLIFWKLIKTPKHRISWSNKEDQENSTDDEDQQEFFDSSTVLISNSLNRTRKRREYFILSFRRKFSLIKPLVKFMIPLVFVYFAEYLINQGLVEFIVFDCSRSFGMNRFSQYRWNQVLYQLGVFISRSSIRFFKISYSLFPLIAFLQCLNMGALFSEALVSYLPHISIVMLIVFYEGLLGGSAYVNTFHALHNTVIPKQDREFSMSFCSISDSLGIVTAGFLAIPMHNLICHIRK